MAIDFDEYVDIDTPIHLFLKENSNLDGIKINLIHKKCGGRLCHLDYIYNYTEIPKELHVVTKDNPKFIEKTRGLSRYQRPIHVSFYTWKYSKIINGSHIRCLSWYNNKKRICTNLQN